MNVKDLKNEEQANGLSNNLENDIQDKIINLQQKIPYLDYVKADYMFEADILLDAILNYKNDKTSEFRKEEVKRISNYLANTKEELIRELIEYMNVINTLEHDINMWKCQNK